MDELFIKELLAQVGFGGVSIGVMIKWVMNKISRAGKELKELHDKVIILEERTKNL